jgi:hypothetical protein
MESEATSINSEVQLTYTICTKQFKSTRRLNEHIKRVHSSTEDRTCPHCSKVMKNAGSLPTHIRTCKKKPSNEIECVIEPRHFEKSLNSTRKV